jgi:hypothetical protein
LALPEVPFDPDEEQFPVVRAAQQLRRMNVQPVLVEPDSPAQALRHRAYYVPAGFFQPEAPAAVIVRENLEDDGAEEAVALLRGAIHHTAGQCGLRPDRAIFACDEAGSPCAPDEEALLRAELATWWGWWAPRNLRRRPAFTRRPAPAAA